MMKLMHCRSVRVTCLMRPPRQWARHGERWASAADYSQTHLEPCTNPSTVRVGDPLTAAVADKELPGMSRFARSGRGAHGVAREANGSVGGVVKLVGTRGGFQTGRTYGT
jgi:hypothetical protein